MEFEVEWEIICGAGGFGCYWWLEQAVGTASHVLRG